ncbi:aspartate aminotransferase family protein [Candidatus Pseudothioglobus singularis]|nr:aspartate aminotransferase family protein [Candidatus Pseudothioglobus singularis]
MNKNNSKFYDAHWMPYSGNREFKANPRMIVSAKGTYFTDDKGREIFDGLSGLWTCGAGHSRPEIIEAVSKQIETLDYSPAFQFGHEKSFELANKIIKFTPKDLDRVFFTCSGSEAVDSALKIARAYWRQKGKVGKTRLIGRIKGYHGVNFGGISVGGIGPNREMFGQGIEADHLQSTVLPENTFSKGQPKVGEHLADELLNKILLHGASNIAAVIVEPMAGSAGVFPPPIGYLKKLRKICDSNDILLIFDEVITAFGRMGAKTGAEAFGVTPDIMTFAKQVSNGSQPLGGVVVNNSIYETFMDTSAPNYLIELFHGYTYSAHPVACAASIASLDILQNENLIERVKKMSPIFEKELHSLKRLQYVADIRNYGLAGGITIESAKNEPALRPYQIAMKCWDKGFYVRYGGDTIQLGLPFIVSEKQIKDVIGAISDSIKELH